MNQKINSTLDTAWFYLLMLGLALAGIITAFFFGTTASEIFFDVKPITIVSFLLFVAVVILSVIKPQYYYSFLFFVLLAFPSPVNDVFPGVLAGGGYKGEMIIFPLFTHIDAFLLLGICVNLYRNNFRLMLTSSVLALVVAALILISTIVNAFDSNSIQEMLLLATGTFQLRFLLLSVLLVATQDMSAYKNELITGLFFSIAFLLVEAFVNSKMHGHERLVSGTLAVNTFGNITAGIFIFWFTILRNTNKYKMLCYAGILLCLVIILLTKNRMSLFAIPITLVLFYLIRKKGIIHYSRVIILITAIVALLPTAIEYSDRILPARFEVKKIIEGTQMGNLTEGSIIDVENNEATSSLHSRMLLYNASLKMLFHNPWFGVGAGRWNYFKMEYGFTIDVFLDSHNGILSMLSQYGVSGIPLLFFIYIYPIVLFFRIQRIENNLLSYVALINFTMFVCDLTNAGIFKYQVFAVLVMNVFILLQVYRKVKTENKTVNLPAI